MVKKVINYVKENNIFKSGDSVLLGVSGGADSICMLYILQEIKQKFNLNYTVVHVNHHIRGKQAQNDSDYVKKVCDKFGIKFIQVDANIKAIVEDTGMSEEEAGRIVRYEAFSMYATASNCNKIAVAHNLNDNSETVLFNLFRGTGIKGLCGIPVKRDMIVRPILCCHRNEIIDYLKKNNIDYCNDSTNNEKEYTRNRIRLDVIPYIKENINEKAEYNIVSASNYLCEISDFLEEETIKAYSQFVFHNIFSEKGFGIHIAIKKEIIRKMIRETCGKLKDITGTHINQVIELEKMSVSKQVSLPYNLVASRTYEGIKICTVKNTNQSEFVSKQLISNGKILPTKDFSILLENSEFNKGSIEDLLYTKWFDYDRIHSLTLRNRQEGDYIIIDNKNNRKKLKDYFINEKIPREIRDKILLLADGDHIVWIIGYRISSYYKVTKNTNRVLKVIYDNKNS